MAKLSVDRALLKARSHIKKGEVDEALQLYQQVLDVFPRNKRAQEGLTALSNPPQEIINQLIDIYNHGQLAETIEQAQKLVEQYPNAFIIWNILGVTATKIGNVSEAIKAFGKVTQLNPNFVDAHYNMGIFLQGQGRLEEAIDSYNKAVSLNPNYAEAHNNMAMVLKDQGKLEEAIDSYNKALSIDPNYTKAYNNMGIVLKDQGKLEEAIGSFNKALFLNPNYVEAYNNIGNVLQKLGKLAEALDSYNKALSLNPNYAEAYNNIGIVLRGEGRFEEAIDSYNKAVSLNPNYAEAHNNVAMVLRDQGKLEEAIDACNKGLSLNPNYTEAYNNLGVVLHDQGKREEAMDAYNKALSLNPNYAEAHNNIGIILQDQGKRVEAISAYSKALLFEPDNEEARARKLHQQAHICDWVAIKEDTDVIPKLGITKQYISPFLILSLEDVPERHRLRSEIYAKVKYPQKPLPIESKPLKKPKRLRIAYFSADFKEHAVAYLMAKIFENHDREQFEIFGYSIFGKKEDNLTKRIVKSFDVFNDVQDMNDKEVALLARQDQIDIAIDLNGYTENCRTGIFAYRAAPIQINYLGYPGTMGAKFMDYIIADQILIPGDLKRHYSENIIFLPNSYMATDNTLPIAEVTPSRFELGLPEKGFIFCAINNNYKYSLAEFEIWIRLLKKIDDSVLWLLESNEFAKENLIAEVTSHGIDPKRIIFAKKVSHDKYLAQFRHADLFIDTFNYNAGATACNALWAGLPVVTKFGQSYTARMAGSLLSAINLPELITETVEEYEELILELASTPKRLMDIKQKLAENRLTQPLFNSELFTQHLEDSYQQVYQNYFDGKPHQTIYVNK